PSIKVQEKVVEDTDIEARKGVITRTLEELADSVLAQSALVTARNAGFVFMPPEPSLKLPTPFAQSQSSSDEEAQEA
ncbi:unnamed protein product, partial [Amoebophrya sp. A25]